MFGIPASLQQQRHSPIVKDSSASIRIDGVRVFIVAAILTPPDWVSQVLLAIPMVGLYLLGVGVAYAFGGARSKSAERERVGSP